MKKLVAMLYSSLNLFTRFANSPMFYISILDSLLTRRNRCFSNATSYSLFSITQCFSKSSLEGDTVALERNELACAGGAALKSPDTGDLNAAP